MILGSSKNLRLHPLATVFRGGVACKAWAVALARRANPGLTTAHPQIAHPA
jgi:hypothetical protein